MTETLAIGYWSESAQRGLSNEYQHGFRWFCKNPYVLVFWTKVASALEGLNELKVHFPGLIPHSHFPTV